MSAIRKSSEDYRTYILSNIEKHPSDIAKMVVEKYAISRQAANKHLQKLVAENVLSIAGNTKSRVYSLTPQVNVALSFFLRDKLSEIDVWQRDIKPNLGTYLITF